jgi:hypothetical protein
LIQIANEDRLDDGDVWMRIRPMIMSYVSEQVLTDLIENEQNSVADSVDENSTEAENMASQEEAQAENEEKTESKTTSLFAE